MALSVVEKTFVKVTFENTLTHFLAKSSKPSVVFEGQK